MLDIDSVITDYYTLMFGYTVRDGFIFTSSDASNIYDAIVIRNPAEAVCSRSLGISPRTLDEHIEALNRYSLTKAIVIADDISFLKRCPTLTWLWVQPSNSAPNGFDFSPLYELPSLSHLRCESVYGEKENKCGVVDYARMPGLKSVSIHAESGHVHFDTLSELRNLEVSNIKGRKKAKDYLSGTTIQRLDFLSCGIESLEGLENCAELESLYLGYNRKLTDISAIAQTADTLKVLDIENCPKISNFSCIEKLTNLAALRLMGQNTLPNLEFLRGLRNLKMFSFSMNVLDGDLSLCTKIPYVSSERNRKHYNIKDKDLPKELAPIKNTNIF